MSSPSQVPAATTGYPGQSEEAHPAVFITVPTQPTTKKPGQLTSDQVQHYFDEGYVVVEDFFSPEELEPAKAAIAARVDAVADRLYRNGKIKNLYKEYDIYKRMTMIEKEFPQAGTLSHKIGEMPKEFSDLWANDRLLNVMEQLLGTSDIVGSPIWNLRVKTPGCEQAIVPWHQDSSYFEKRSYDKLVVTAWLPFLDATPENGCMQYVRRGHRAGKTANHECCWRDTWYTMASEEELERSLGVDMKKDVVTAPVKFGGFILFSNIIPHRSLPNVSDDIRWSIDLRWHRADVPACFYDIKHPIWLRSSTNPNLKIDWDRFNGKNRSWKEEEREAAEKDFGTEMGGPWMAQWPITNANRHTALLPESLRTLKKEPPTIY